MQIDHTFHSSVYLPGAMTLFWSGCAVPNDPSDQKQEPLEWRVRVRWHSEPKAIRHVTDWARRCSLIEQTHGARTIVQIPWSSLTPPLLRRRGTLWEARESSRGK